MKISNAKNMARAVSLIVFGMIFFISPGYADFITPGQGSQTPPGSYGTGQMSQPSPGSHAAATGQPSAVPGLLPVTATNLFYTPSAFQTQQAIPMAMACKTLLKVAGNPCGIAEVKPGAHVFRTNDRIRFKFQGNSDGYLYIFQQGSDGSTNRLFPHPKFQNNSNQIDAYREYMIPVGGWFRFDATAGIEKLYFFLSKNRIREFEASPAQGHNPVAVPINQQTWQAVSGYYNRSGKNLIAETDPGQTGNGVYATPISYVAQLASNRQPMISAIIRLNHKH